MKSMQCVTGPAEQEDNGRVHQTDVGTPPVGGKPWQVKSATSGWKNFSSSGVLETKTATNLAEKSALSEMGIDEAQA